MKYVICYDLADDQRRSRLVNVLLDYAARIQESVFFADIEERLYSELREKVTRLIEPQTDVVHLFPICEACAKRKEVYGRGEVPEDREWYIV